jgi:hypothetical protein
LLALASFQVIAATSTGAGETGAAIDPTGPEPTGAEGDCETADS